VSPTPIGAVPLAAALRTLSAEVSSDCEPCHNLGVDFAAEIEAIESFLAERGTPFAVIGGVALAAYGHPRMTLDLDLVTEACAQDAVVAFLEARGFATLHRSSGYSNHRHADRRHGRVDFMYVRDDTARRLFTGVRRLAGPGGRPIPVPRPEHLVAMKVHAMKQDPARTWQEMADIGYLVTLEGVDRAEIEGYFQAADLGEQWHAIARLL
jgi:hypothetical protein